MIELCDLCQSGSGLFDFSRVCCRARFILSLPDLETRRAWIERWREKDGKDMTDAVEEEVRQQWDHRKNI